MSNDFSRPNQDEVITEQNSVWRETPMLANVPVVPQLLTLETVARALCVSPHTVRSWVRKGKLRPIRLCRRLLFDPDEIARFLAAAK
jgi:excisionase family DNA binding protein